MAIWFTERAKKVHRALFFAALCWVLALASAGAAFADAPAGRQAFAQGDYNRAVIEWQSAADRGDAEAQFGLGKLYELGLGDLKQDYKRADYWYRKSADQGNTEAQYRLALIWMAGGDGFPPDLIEAYKWAVLGGESHGVWGTAASDLKALLDQALGPQDKNSGKERAEAWQKARRPKDEQAAAPAAAPPPPPVQPPALPAATSGGNPTTTGPGAGGCPGF